MATSLSLSSSTKTTNRNKKLILQVATGILLFFSFPPFGRPWIGWLALVPLFIDVLSDTSMRSIGRKGRLAKEASAGEVAGTRSFVKVSAGSALGGLVWGGGLFYPLLYTYDGSSIERLAGLFILSLLTASFLFLFDWLLRLGAASLRRGSVGLLFSAPAIWLVMEYLLRTWAFGFSPYLALTQYNQSFFLRLAPLTGIHGVSGAVVFVNALIALTVFRFVAPLIWAGDQSVSGKDDAPKPFRWPGVALFLIGLAACTIVFVSGSVPLKLSGATAPQSVDAQPAATTGMLLVQPNISAQAYAEARANPSLFYTIVDDLVAQSQVALTQLRVPEEPVTVVWPETVLHVDGWNNDIIRRKLINFTTENNVSLMIGLPRIARPIGDLPGTSSVAAGEAMQYNSAFVIRSDGHLASVYDKVHVIPIAESQFLPGHQWEVHSDGAHRFGLGICSDVVVPSHALKTVREGATSLHYIASLGQIPSIAPLVTALAVFRAAEHHLYVTQTATTGPTFVVDPLGTIIDITMPDEKSRIYVSIPTTDHQFTLYTRYGDWVVVLASLIMCVISVRMHLSRLGL